MQWFIFLTHSYPFVGCHCFSVASLRAESNCCAIQKTLNTALCPVVFTLSIASFLSPTWGMTWHGDVFEGSHQTVILLLPRLHLLIEKTQWVFVVTVSASIWQFRIQFRNTWIHPNVHAHSQLHLCSPPLFADFIESIVIKILMSCTHIHFIKTKQPSFFFSGVTS